MGRMMPLARREASTAAKIMASTRMISRGWIIEASSTITVDWSLARRITVPSLKRRAA